MYILNTKALEVLNKRLLKLDLDRMTNKAMFRDGSITREAYERRSDMITVSKAATRLLFEELVQESVSDE